MVLVTFAETKVTRSAERNMNLTANLVLKNNSDYQTVTFIELFCD